MSRSTRNKLADRPPLSTRFEPSPTRPVRCVDGLARPWNQTLEIAPGKFVSKWAVTSP